MGPALLSLPELNRATLARQLLLERSAMPPLRAVEHLVGLQAQTPQTWYTGLWGRLEAFDPAAFGRLLESRDVVRIALMRSTVHLVTARDALFLRPLVQPVIERSTRGSFTRFWNDLDLPGVAEEGKRVLAASPTPITQSELGRALQKRWPDRDALALAQVIRSRLALVQVPPRGVWQKSGLARLTTIEAWLGAPLDPAPSVATMVLRYLGAFGPASVMDVQAWCGLTRLNEVVDRLRPSLAVFRDENGRELFDLPDAPRPPGDIPAPVRFLYDYDNILLSHSDRSRMTDYDFFANGWTADGVQPSCLLIDGRVAGTWLITKSRGRSSLEVRTFEPALPDVVAGIEAEGEQLLSFASGVTDRREIQVTSG